MNEDPRIPEIRAVLTEYVRTDDLDALFGVRQRIRAIVDRPAPAPRVFFPGDTIPPFVTVMSVNGQIEVGERWSWENEDKDPWIEIWTPEPDVLQAAVEQAKTDRANAEWQHTDGVTP